MVPCTRAFVITVRHILGRSTHPWAVCIFVLRLSVHIFLVLVGEVDSPPIYLHPPYGASGICSFGFFVLQVIPLLVYLIAMTSHPCPIWTFTWCLRYVLECTFLSQCLRRFWGGSKVVGKFLVVPVWYGLSVPSNLLGDILYCRWFFELLTACLATWEP